MRKKAQRMTLHKETLHRLDTEGLLVVAGGIVTQACPCTKTCDSCSPCTLGASCHPNTDIC